MTNNLKGLNSTCHGVCASSLIKKHTLLPKRTFATFNTQGKTYTLKKKCSVNIVEAEANIPNYSLYKGTKNNQNRRSVKTESKEMKGRNFLKMFKIKEPVFSKSFHFSF